jgi:hypothetical protein
MAELLTKKIAYEYQTRAAALPDNGLQDIGDRRNLRIEIQSRCGLTELEAVNVLNGHNVVDYISKYTRRAYAANQIRG